MLHFCLLLNAGVRNFCYTLYILQDYYSAHQRPGSRPTAFHMFIEQIYHELVGTHRRAAVNLPHRCSGADMSSTLVNVGTVPVHMPERPQTETRNHRCVVCTEKHKVAKKQNPGCKEKELPKRSKTVYPCSVCQVFLCISSLHYTTAK